MSLLKKLMAKTAPVEEEKSFSFSEAEFQEVVDKATGKEVAIVPPKVLATNRVGTYETDTSQTVLKLFALAPDTDFTFLTKPGHGADYLNAMRQVISRARKAARQRKMNVKHWKVLVRDFESTPTYDKLTLVRTQLGSLKQESLCHALIDLMNAEVENEEDTDENEYDFGSSV